MKKQCGTCARYNPDICYGICKLTGKPKNEDDKCKKWRAE